MARRLLVIRNPTSGGGSGRRLFEAASAALIARGCPISIHVTSGPGDATDRARQARNEGFDAVVAAGGDGTVNEVVNGLIGGAMPFGLMPIGTANALSFEIGQKRDPESIADTLALGPIRPFWPGIANGRAFALMAGVGFDAHVVAHVSPRVKRMLGPAAYVCDAVIRVVGWRGRTYRVRLNDRVMTVGSAVAAKSGRYGGPFVISRLASPERPELRLVTADSSGRLALFWSIIGLMLKRLDHWPGVSALTVERLTIEGPLDEPVQLDGDILARLPVEIGVAPAPLGMIRPRTASAD